MLRAAFALARRDLLAASRRRAAWAEPFAFFTVVMILFPLALDAAVLEKAAPAMIWISVLLANFLSLEKLLRPDFDNGSLEQILIGSCPPAVAVLVKVLVHWLIVSVPLLVLAPLYAALLFLSPAAAWVTVAALALGTLTVNLIGAAGAALVVTLHRSSLLSGLLVMPLYIPTLMFGAHATAAASFPAASGQLAMLGAMLISALILAPLAAAAALRVTLE